MKPKVRHRRLQIRKDPGLRQLAEGVGRFIEHWGFKSVQGRLWLYLYVSEEPLSSIELAQVLEVSPALVTQSVQILLRYKVILPAAKGPNGVLRYAANPDAAEGIRRVLRQRESVLLGKVGEAITGAIREHEDSRRGSRSGLKISRERLGQVAEWTGLFQLLLELGIASLERKDNPFTEPMSFRAELDWLARR